jgi:hypothetical protein
MRMADSTPRHRPLCAFLALLVLVTASCRPEATETPPADAVVDSDSPRDLARMVERMLPALERLSGLDRVEPLRVRRQSRDGAREYMRRRMAEEMPPEELDAARRTYVALGMLPDTLDLEALLVDLYTEQVLGYYDPGEKTLFIVTGQNAGDIQSVMAHELVHALQDQHTNLDSLIARERGNDRQTAAHAAMEGHALLVMFAFLAEQATRQPVDPTSLPDPAQEMAGAIDAQNSEFPVFRRAPPVIRETLLFPYVSGAGFVHALWSSLRPRERYPAPLDSLLPQSTEQVLRPRERFVHERDEPISVSVPAPPAHWRVVRQNDFGQLETALFLTQHLGSAARTAADGWGGDAYVLLNRDGIDIIDWWSAWDTDSEADRFADAVLRAASTRTGRQVIVERQPVSGRPGVRVVDAPADVELPPEFRAARSP